MQIQTALTAVGLLASIGLCDPNPAKVASGARPVERERGATAGSPKRAQDYPAEIWFTGAAGDTRIAKALPIAAGDTIPVTLHMKNNGAREVFDIGRYGHMTLIGFPSDLRVPPGGEDSISFRVAPWNCPRSVMTFGFTRKPEATGDTQGGIVTSLETACPATSTGEAQPGKQGSQSRLGKALRMAFLRLGRDLNGRYPAP